MNTVLIIIIIIFFFFFSSHLLIMTIPTAFSAGDQYIQSYCSLTSGKYTPGIGNYSQSMTYLVDDLCANAPTPAYNGFRNASWAEDPTNRTYGLVLCRGDVSMNDCGTCLNNAVMGILQTKCKAAIIWHEHCMFKYSNKPFFGQIDTDNIHKSNDYYAGAFWNGTFTNQTLDLLNGLVDEAAKNTAVPLYAGGTTVLKYNETVNETVYAMVQCTRDLSVVNCTTCLNGAITDLPNPWLPSKGAKAFRGSCIMRYAMDDPFLMKT